MHVGWETPTCCGVIELWFKDRVSSLCCCTERSAKLWPGSQSCDMDDQTPCASVVCTATP